MSVNGCLKSQTNTKEIEYRKYICIKYTNETTLTHTDLLHSRLVDASKDFQIN